MSWTLLGGIILIAVIVTLMRSSRRASPPTPPVEAPAPAAASSTPDQASAQVRVFVHRGALVEGLCARVRGAPVVMAEHAALLDDSRLLAVVVLEGKNDQLLPVTSAVLAAQDDPTAAGEAFVRTANDELEALPFTWTQRAPGCFACAAPDDRAPARLLRTARFAELPFADRAVAMVPALDTLLVADGADDAALAAMLDAAEPGFPGPKWFTLAALEWQDGAWRHTLPGKDPALRQRFQAALSRSVLIEFQDAAVTCDFPLARACVVDGVVVTTWVATTSVVVPDRYVGDLGELHLVDPRRPGEVVSVNCDLVDEFLLRLLREQHLGYSVLDAKLFPPPEVLALLERIDDTDASTQVTLSGAQARPLLEQVGGLVLPGCGGSAPQVWLTDGRWTSVAVADQDALVAALPGPVQAWTKQVAAHVQRRDAAAPRKERLAALEAAVPGVKALLQESRHADALARIEELYALHGFEPGLLDAAVGLAATLQRPDAVRTWCRRGLEHQPLNQSWRGHLMQLQLQEAAVKAPMAQLTAAQLDEAGPRGALMPVLRPPGHGAQQRELLEAMAASRGVPKDKLLVQEPLRWPLARGIEVELVYDGGKTMRPLSMMDAAGGLAGELKAVALANLEAASGGAIPRQEGAAIANWPDGFAASRLLLKWSDLDWAGEAPQGPLVAMTPLYDSFVVARADEPAALERMMREAETAVAKADQAWRSMLTALPWRLEDDRWVPHEFEAGSPLAARVAKLEEAIAKARRTSVISR